MLDLRVRILSCAPAGMPKSRAKSKKSRSISYARLSTLAKGRILGLLEAGTPQADVVKAVRKKDGSFPSSRAVRAVRDQFRKDPSWEGEPSRSGGRPRELTAQQEKKLKALLLREVGRVHVTATYAKRKLPELRDCSDKLIQRTFQRLGYS